MKLLCHTLSVSYTLLTAYHCMALVVASVMSLDDKSIRLLCSRGMTNPNFSPSPNPII